jgi:hypothetical protein
MGLTMFESTGLFLGWIVCTYLIVQITLGIQDALREVNGELTDKLHKRINDIVHRVRVERVQDTYYWYDMDDNRFLAQGSSDEEIVANLKSRFPTHMFFLPTNHLICAKTDWQPKLVGQKVDQ